VQANLVAAQKQVAVLKTQREVSAVHWLLVEPPALVRERRGRLAGGIGIVLVALWLGCLEIVLDKGQREDWSQSSFIIGFAWWRCSPSCW
jgi:hypothetical protein